MSPVAARKDDPQAAEVLAGRNGQLRSADAERIGPREHQFIIEAVYATDEPYVAPYSGAAKLVILVFGSAAAWAAVTACVSILRL